MNSSIDKGTNKKVFTIANEITAATNAEYTINGIKDSVHLIKLIQFQV